jgi:glycosyltransferase involved in cell wall biosynthesis
MSDLVMVDWLGRGGIAQTTEAWRAIAVDAGLSVRVVSRSSEAVRVDASIDKRLPGVVGIVDAHQQLARLASRTVRQERPRVLYLQNYWLPFFEYTVVRAAKAVGCRVVIAVHNHRSHELRAGTVFGLRRLLGLCDDVVVHSDFVGGNLRTTYDVDPIFVEHPVQTGVLKSTPEPVSEVERRIKGRRVAVLFGVLGRSYKGADALHGLASLVVDDWLVVAAGVGASKVRGAELTVDRFLSEGELHWLLARADVALLPYRRATQSGAVVLAQLLGAPPIVTAVGGIPDQVASGTDGLLIEPNGGVDVWADALRRIGEQPEWWGQIRRQASARSERRQVAARSSWLSVVSR